MGTVSKSVLCSIQYGLHGHSQQYQQYMAFAAVRQGLVYMICGKGSSNWLCSATEGKLTNIKKKLKQEQKNIF